MLVLALAIGLRTGGEPARADGLSYDWDEITASVLLDVSRLERLGTSDSLRVFWWNIDRCAARENAGSSPLDRNLRQLVADESLAPDAIILSEFSRDGLAPETLGAIEGRYSATFYEYNPQFGSCGIVLFLRLPSRAFEPEVIDWAPRDEDVEGRWEYRQAWIRDYDQARGFKRPYIRHKLTIPGGGKELNLLPVHLLQPWTGYQQVYGSRLGRFAIAWNLFLGTDNPLYHQLSHLRRYLERDFGNALDGEPLILIGDFNLPKAYGPRSTPGFRMISEGLFDAFSRNRRPTFPARSSGSPISMPRMQIDHALVSRGNLEVVAAEVLPLRGSDHLGLYLIVR